MKRNKALMVIPVLAFLFALIPGCIIIDSVSQPETGYLHRPFEAVVQNITDDDFDLPGNPVFAVNLPDSREIVACKALLNDSTVYSCDVPDPDNSADINDKYYPGNWQSRGMPMQDIAKGDKIQVTWTIRPNTPGKHKLDFWTSVYFELAPGDAFYEVEIDPDPQANPAPLQS